MFNQVVSQYKEPWLHMQMFGNLPAVQNDTQMLPQIIDTAASMGQTATTCAFYYQRPIVIFLDSRKLYR